MKGSKFSRRAMRCCSVTLLVLARSAAAGTVPFTEEFSTSANWFSDALGVVPLTLQSSGGPDGSSFVSTTFNFAASAVDQTRVLMRGQDEFNSSGGAFVGNWIADGVTQFSAFVRHDAEVPMTFFTRFSSPANFPGATAIGFVPVPPDTWTPLTIGISPGNPQFISFESSDFNTVFSSIGHVQIGVSVPAGLAGVDQVVTFGLDKVSIVPEPATLGLLAVAAAAMPRRKNDGRRCSP